MSEQQPLKPIFKLLPKEQPPLTDYELEKRASMVAALTELREEAIKGNVEMIAVIYQTSDTQSPSSYTFADRGFMALAGTILQHSAIDHNK